MRPITIPSQETISRLESEAEGFSRISQKRAGFALIVFRQNPVSLIGLLIVVMLILASIAGPYIVPYGPDAVNPRIKMQPPGLSHPFGTDTYGRDVLSRVVSAARVDLLIAMTSIGIAFAIGIVMGSIAAYLRGLADTLLMRFLDIVQSFPQFILGMGLAVAIGPGLRNLIIVITVIMTPGFARMVRSRILSLREMPYVDAARCSGVPALRIIFVYLVPNSLGPIIVSCALNISYAMLDAAGLSFIGLGIRPPQAEWGMMISDGMNNMLAGEWWVSVFPGLALFISVLGFNLFADGLRDIIDPRMRR
jgi:peptide/nickel transport system permease protein